MALTKVSTDGVKDDAITKTKIPANQIEASELADNAVDTNAIADQAVALSKLPHGTSSNDGKFLRANNGADPTFETVSTDLVADTSPQLGGNLDTNSFEINLDDNHSVNFGDSTDLNIKHTGVYGVLQNTTGGFFLQGENAVTIKANNNVEILKATGDENMAKFIPDGAVELYHNNEKVLATDGSKVNFKQRIQIHNDAPASGHGMAIGQWDGSNHRIEGDANRPIVITSYNSGGIKMGVSGANKVAVNSHGIVFNGDTAAANALDDYEEGTYTPTPNSGTATSNDGQYTKIGNFCIVTASITPSGNGTGGAMVQISLPFTAAGGRSGSGFIRYSNSSISNTITMHVNGSNASMDWYQFGGSPLTYSEASNNRYDFCITYRTA